MAHVFASPSESIPSSMVDQWNMETKRRIAEAKVTSDAIQRWKEVTKGQAPAPGTTPAPKASSGIQAPPIPRLKRRRLEGSHQKKDSDRFERNAADKYEIVTKWSIVAPAVVPPRHLVPTTKTAEQHAAAKIKRDRALNRFRTFEGSNGKITRKNFVQMTDFVKGTGPPPQQQLQMQQTAS